MSQAVALPSTPQSPPASPVQSAPPGPMIGLNAFQLLMRCWARLHPYNAGQVMHVSGAPDRDRWKHAAQSVVGELGLGTPRFVQSGRAVRFTPSDDLPLEHTSQPLETYFNEELNRPFAPGDVPIRFCLLPGPEGDPPSHYFAAVYDHWIADSRAMRELMQRILQRYQYPDRPPGLPPLTLQAPDFWRLFRKHIGPFAAPAAMWESLRNLWHHRHGYRPKLRDPMDLDSRLIIRRLPDGLIARLHRFAKTHGASVNDLFIAVAAQSLGAHTAAVRLSRPVRPMHFARHHVGIGTIVDIRDAARQPLDCVFGLYLSSYTVLLPRPEERPLGELVQQTAGVTARLKSSRATVRGFLALAMAQFWCDYYDLPRFHATLLHRMVPVVAGISNVNMSGTWADASAAPALADDNGRPHAADLPQVLDYLRISPAGPLIPLVFTLTTIGGRLSLCVTFRTTGFPEPRAREIVDDFVRRLAALADEDAAPRD